MQAFKANKQTPTKVIKADDLCRVCRCNPAVLGRGKCNLFSGKKSMDEMLADRLSKVLDMPVTKTDGVSSVLCYKCKREFEKYENYMKALQVDLGNFKKRYQQSMGEPGAPLVPERTKRCHVTPGASKKRPCTIPSPSAASVLRTAVPRYHCPVPNHDDLIVATTAASETEVIVHYPSKRVRKVVGDKFHARLVRQIATGELEMAARNVMSDTVMKETILKMVEKDIQTECRGLCGNKEPSILTKTSPDSLIELTDSKVDEEMRRRAPVFHRFMRAAIISDRWQRKSSGCKDVRSVPAISMAGSLLLRARNPKMSANAYRMSILLWHGGAEKQLYSRACRWGLCMGHKRTLFKVDEMGKDFDATVKQWKDKIEYDCKLESMLQTIKECAEELDSVPEEPMNAAATELDIVLEEPMNAAAQEEPMNAASGEELDIVPEEPMNAAAGEELDIVPEEPMNAEEEEPMNAAAAEGEAMNSDGTEELDSVPEAAQQLHVDDGGVKAAVRERMGPHFEEAVYEAATKLINDYGMGDLNSSSLALLKSQLEIGHAAGFQITGDNVDLLIKVKHMSSTNQNKSIHWFNLNAVLHRVLGNELSVDKPLKSIMDIENVDFLPSAEDNQKFLHDIIPLAARVIADNIPAFKKFGPVVVRHIPHAYSQAMKEKSTQVNNTGTISI